MLPTGLITLLFTDIEASTRLVQLLGERYPDLLAEHHAILRQAISTWDGLVVDTQGDAFFAVFPQAVDALAAAISIQNTLNTHSWPDGVQVRVRMGLHTGEPALTHDGYYVGLDLHRAARVCAAAHGGQILLTQTTCNLVLADLPFGVSLRDLGDHRLKDIDRPERLYQLVLPNLANEFPPLRSLELFVHNLPTALTSFIGREKEIRDVTDLLQQFRLVTLTGPGGTGKTRLAIQVANTQLELFAHGVRFVELAPIADATLLPQTVAEVLGLREEPGQPIRRTLGNYLRNRAMLLVLDNCEHLVDAAAELATFLLTTCTHLKILASSREPLGIPGERSYAVPTLSMPPPGSRHLPPLIQLTQYEAMRLFIERAETVMPHFSVNNQNAPLIAHICQRLDGIPLAIELAAARIKTLTVEQIADRLDDRFHLLKGNNQRTVPRQKTLRALIDWSYDLLTDIERLLFRRLSAFVGGWSLEAAEAVVTDDLLPVDELIDVLERLVNKSLVTLSRESGQQARYGFLDSIGQYAREKLVEAGEMATIREAHLRYFLAQAQVAEPQLKGKEQMHWWQWLEAEMDNIRAALTWAEPQGQGNSPWLPQSPQFREEGAQLAAALWWFWLLTGHLNEATQWLDRYLVHLADSPAVAAPIYNQLIWRNACLSYFANQFQRASQLAEQAVTLCQQHGDQDGLAIAYFVQASVARSQLNYPLAERLYQQSYHLFQQAGNEWGIALVLNLLAWKAFLSKEYDRAEMLGQECLRLRRKIGVKAGVAAALDILGAVARVKGEYQQAEALLQESLLISKGLSSFLTTNVTLIQLGHIAQARGEYERASDYFGEALHLSRQLNEDKDITELLGHLMIARWRQGDVPSAAALLAEAVSLCHRLGLEQSAAAYLIGLTKTTHAQDNPDRAKAIYEIGITLISDLTEAERAELATEMGNR
ncbi:MAG: adenylate/guanylate cyclase domain-containing protein [Anaerolineae bacterium]|nr:adenylate/guanylate cyclase domain-containing protein [Anaerolineae bacterium]